MQLRSTTIAVAFVLAGCAANPSDGTGSLNTAEDARLAAADELHHLGFKSLDRVVWTIIALDSGWEIIARNTLGQHQHSDIIGGPPRFEDDSHRYIFDSRGEVIHHEVGVWEFDRLK